MWDLELVCELAAAGLERRAHELDEEQALRGIDCLSELALHDILRAALGAPHPDGSRFSVLAEQRYPGDALKPRRSEGERCDIVLLPPISEGGTGGTTPGGTPGLPRRGLSGEGDSPARASDEPEDTDDAPTVEPRLGKPAVPPDSPWHQRLLDPLEAGTLFASHGVPPEEALWIEVKVAAQFALIDGVARANPRYSGVMLREVPGDARKLARDPVIRNGAVMVVLFNADEATAAHDLEAWRARCIEKGWALGTPRVRRLSINDRIGNGVASVMVCGTEPG